MHHCHNVIYCREHWLACSNIIAGSISWRHLSIKLRTSYPRKLVNIRSPVNQQLGSLSVAFLTGSMKWGVTILHVHACNECSWFHNFFIFIVITCIGMLPSKYNASQTKNCTNTHHLLCPTCSHLFPCQSST